MRPARSSRPVVIAHRGASGYLPEHTLVAKALAAGMGADFLEQDVVATRDGELIVFHDLTLDAMTDVATVFPGRARTDGHYYCIDFTLAEIRTLSVGERRRPDGTGPRYAGRFPDGAGRFQIPTLNEELAFIDGLARALGRPLGVYPEIKEPDWHRRHGIDLAAGVVAALEAGGWGAPQRPVYLQCFDAGELQRLAGQHQCRFPRVQLLDVAGGVPSATCLAQIAGYAQGIGPSLRLLGTGQSADEPPVSLIGDAHAAGLVVHPYTVRRDDLPAGYQDVDELLDHVVHRLGADGVFTDFPDLVVAWVRRRFPG
ncbi:MAG: glycerophosphodiester phosphodiesterase [Gammaproteobacteria bacterium]|nr:glycerophosphodiester phosphodiesterase [Gammaproteobacteria bacterium]